MSLRARVRSLEARRGAGCRLCAGRQVIRVEYPEGRPSYASPPDPKSQELRFCDVCGRDCGLVIKVIQEPVPIAER